MKKYVVIVQINGVTIQEIWHHTLSGARDWKAWEKERDARVDVKIYELNEVQ